MTTEAPPIYKQLIDEETKATLPWIVFFNQCFNGDAGASWTPTFENLTETGGDATITGIYYKLSKYLTFFRVTIIPATSTSSTAGTTYISNFPIQFQYDGVCFAVTGGSAGAGHIVSSTNAIYTPTWTDITNSVTILGIGEAQ